ncbi:hypothetical protein ADUPG1_012907, partial [Aduncisulcus paluster]
MPHILCGARYSKYIDDQPPATIHSMDHSRFARISPFILSEKSIYSKVFKAIDHETGNIVAWNELDISSFKPEEVDSIMKEMELLCSESHERMVNVISFWTETDDKTLIFITEIENDAKYISLHEFVCNTVKTEHLIPVFLVEKICKQLLEGVEHLRSMSSLFITNLHYEFCYLNKSSKNLKIRYFGLISHLIRCHIDGPLTSSVGPLGFKIPKTLSGDSEIKTFFDYCKAILSPSIVGKMLKDPILSGCCRDPCHVVEPVCGISPS